MFVGKKCAQNDRFLMSIAACGIPNPYQISVLNREDTAFTFSDTYEAYYVILPNLDYCRDTNNSV